MIRLELAYINLIALFILFTHVDALSALVDVEPSVLLQTVNVTSVKKRHSAKT